MINDYKNLVWFTVIIGTLSKKKSVKKQTDNDILDIMFVYLLWHGLYRQANYNMTPTHKK